MDKEVNQKQWLGRGLIMGALAGSIFLVSNRNARTKMTDCMGECRSKTNRWISVIKDNRESFLEQIKASGAKISTIIDNATEDIEKIMETSQHMKSHTKDLFETLQQTKEDFQNLTEKLKIEESDAAEETPKAKEEENLH